jgi:hypothetical protein
VYVSFYRGAAMKTLLMLHALIVMPYEAVMRS